MELLNGKLHDKIIFIIYLNYIYLYSRNLIADLLRNNIEKLGRIVYLENWNII